jgi:hypothetical protein
MGHSSRFDVLSLNFNDRAGRPLAAGEPTPSSENALAAPQDD